jgi:hypothetical protein
LGVRFHDAPPPSKDDVGEVARRVRDRALLWLRRRAYLDERAAEERSNETVVPSALDACTQLALAGGAFLARPFQHKDNPDAALERRERRFSAACYGFDVHCAVRIAADDHQGRERLVPCIARCASQRMTIRGARGSCGPLPAGRGVFSKYAMRPKAVRRILDHLNLPSHPRTAAPARDPTWQPMAFGFDAA